MHGFEFTWLSDKKSLKKEDKKADMKQEAKSRKAMKRDSKPPTAKTPKETVAAWKAPMPILQAKEQQMKESELSAKNIAVGFLSQGGSMP